MFMLTMKKFIILTRDTFTVIKWLLICIDLSLFLTTVIAIPDAIGALINPEYYALKDLLDQLIPKESN